MQVVSIGRIGTANAQNFKPMVAGEHDNLRAAVRKSRGPASAQPGVTSCYDRPFLKGGSYVTMRARSPITKHIIIIRRALTAIDRSLGRLIALTNGAGRGAPSERPATKRKLKLSPKRRAELKLQGRYMGYVRNLKPRQKARVKAVRAKKGLRAAIAMAKRIPAG